MQTLGKSLWHGLVNGASTRQRSSAPQPQALGYTGSISQALYWFGFEVTNAVVYGARK
jgi:hypothetical protein